MYLSGFVGITAKLAATKLAAARPAPLLAASVWDRLRKTTKPTTSTLWPTIDRIRSTSVFSPSAPVNIRTVQPSAHYAPAPPSSVPSMQTITLAPLPQGGGDTMIAPDDVAAPEQAGAGDLFKSPVALGLLALGVVLTLNSRKRK